MKGAGRLEGREIASLHENDVSFAMTDGSFTQNLTDEVRQRLAQKVSRTPRLRAAPDTSISLGEKSPPIFCFPEKFLKSAVT